MENMEWFGEFNIVEWDGVIDRVQAVKVWNPRTLAYDVRVRYPDGVVHQLDIDGFERLRPREIHV